MVILVLLMLTVFTACKEKSDVVTSEEAQKIAMEDLGVSEKEVASIHSHVQDHDGVPCYSIYVTVGTVEYEYLISAYTGEIISSGEGSGHSH